MILRQGDMFSGPCDVLLFTGNSTVSQLGCLVMGRGAAREVLNRYPNSDRAFGGLLRGPGGAFRTGVLSDYGVLIHPDIRKPILGAFQVKRFWVVSAQLGLIAGSVDVLCKLAIDHWRDLRVSLNFPGIGNGGLKRADVLPLLQRIPDNVTVWEFPQ
jgi:hypothetical protein